MILSRLAKNVYTDVTPFSTDFSDFATVFAVKSAILFPVISVSGKSVNTVLHRRTCVLRVTFARKTSVRHIRPRTLTAVTSRHGRERVRTLDIFKKKCYEFHYVFYFSALSSF
jgi:hypothetical protein